jgi:ATP-binding protein involved in chromosome partitioning
VTFQAGRNADLRDLKPVGNYALGLTWGDAHESGIYTFEFLHQLGELQEKLQTEGLIALGKLPRASIVRAGRDGP